MSTALTHILIRELGPREGFQVHPKIVPTSEKLALIQALQATGVPEIEVTSMVRPDRVPQLADGEEVARLLPPPGATRFNALYLNVRGFERAESLRALSNRGWLNVATSETFLAKNMNSSLEAVVSTLPDWKQAFDGRGKGLHGILISTAFGCAYEGLSVADRLSLVLERIVSRWHALGGVGPQEICLADTVGLGAPSSIRSAIRLVRSLLPQVAVSLHLHDTRGSGMANVLRGIEEGVRIFECSVGGMGGCPFTKGAAGNVPSEDVAYLCEREGFTTGVRLEEYVKAARLAESILGERLPGKLMRGYGP